MSDEIVLYPTNRKVNDAGEVLIPNLNALEQRVKELEAKLAAKCEYHVSLEMYQDLQAKLATVALERDEVVLEQRRADTFLISCPWCFTKMEQNASRAIKHLVCCGDRVQEEIWQSHARRSHE